VLFERKAVNSSKKKKIRRKGTKGLDDERGKEKKGNSKSIDVIKGM